MYAISLLNKRQQEFMTDLAVKNLSKGSVTTIALARVISRLIAVPGSPVNSVEQYYREQGAGIVDNILEALNQIAPFDHKTAKDLSLHFFRYSYDVSHGDLVSYPAGFQSGLASFFRLNKHFSEDTLCLINDKHQEIAQMVSYLTDIVSVLRKGTNHVAQ